MKPTPGPWRVDPDYSCDIQTIDRKLEIACTSNDVLEAGECPTKAEQHANAHLIAAAPVLTTPKQVYAYAWCLDNGYSKDDALRHALMM